MPGPSAVHDGPRLHLRLPALRRPHGTTAWPPGSRMPGAAQPDTRLSRVVRRSTGERRVRGQRRNREKRPGGRRMRAARRCSNTWRTTEPARSNGTALICARQATQDGVRHVVGYVDNIQDERALRWKARARLHDGAGQPCHCRASGQPCARRPRGAAQQRVRHHRHRRLQAGERQQGPYRRGRAAARDRGHPARQLPCHRRGRAAWEATSSSCCSNASGCRRRCGAWTRWWPSSKAARPPVPARPP